MATGNRVLPGAPMFAEDGAAAGRTMTGGQAARISHAVAAGSAMPGPGGPQAPRGPAGRPPRMGRGAGGRWLVWIMRMLVWAVLLLIGYRGVAAIITGQPVTGGSPVASHPATSSATGFPVMLGQAYALEFGQVYLSYSPAAAAKRAAALAPFLPAGSDPELGWNGAGTQTLQSEQVAGIQVLSAHRAIVTLLAQVDGGRLIELGVPLYSAGGAMVISGQPALLSPPPGADLPAAQPSAPADVAAGRSLAGALPAFFRAYASGNAAALRPFSEPGHRLSGLGGVVTFVRITSTVVPKSAGPVRQILVTVRWLGVLPTSTSPIVPGGPASTAHAPGEIDMTYAMTVVRHAASWLVRSVGAAAVQPGPSS